MAAIHTAHAETQHALKDAAGFAADVEVREWCLAYDLWRPKMPAAKLRPLFIDGLLNPAWPGRAPSRTVQDVEAAEATLTDLAKRVRVNPGDPTVPPLPTLKAYALGGAILAAREVARALTSSRDRTAYARRAEQIAKASRQLSKHATQVAPRLARVRGR